MSDGNNFPWKERTAFFARNDIFKFIHKDSVVFLHSQNIGWALQNCVHRIVLKVYCVEANPISPDDKDNVRTKKKDNKERKKEWKVKSLLLWV